MSNYIIRLDDASDYMDIDRWERMEALLDQYGIKPIFGIIPKNEDESLISQYKHNPQFWDQMQVWISKGWIPAMHGYEHRYITNEGGLNPVNKRSEFAGLPFEEQREKISKGYHILTGHDIFPDIFFAPSHTFDENTLKAIRAETPIRIISDTIAFKPYQKYGFTFIPQQSGSVRNLPFNTVTFCYHPNTMNEKSFVGLENFIKKNRDKFKRVKVLETDKKESFLDKMLRLVYFARR